MTSVNKVLFIFLSLIICFNIVEASKQDGGLCTLITKSVLKSCSLEVLTYQKNKTKNINLSEDFCPYIGNKVCSDCCSDVFAHMPQADKDKFSPKVFKEAMGMCVKACTIVPPHSTSSANNKAGVAGSLPTQSLKKFEKSMDTIEDNFIHQEQENFREVP